uniref:Uncharacterized protein n=1 Tax=Rhipicephalus zambeziensis TaxID=60191 RepID=A0A224Y8N5_9ACAR
MACVYCSRKKYSTARVRGNFKTEYGQIRQDHVRISLAQTFCNRLWCHICCVVVSLVWLSSRVFQSCFSPCTVRCQCTLKNTRWSKFPEPCATASLIITSWFWDVKPQILLIML